MGTEELLEKDYSQGYRRVDKQLISVITGYLHDNYGNQLGKPNLANMEEAFRRDLSFSGFYPEEIHIIGLEDTFEYGSDLWHISYRINDVLTYNAYISPLTDHILKEMSGVIVTSVLIALVLTAGFWYLLHVINRLRTIEEMKDDFTNNMTHELKTPIAIAYAANDALLQFPDPQDEQRTKKYLTAALEQLSKLTGLVENILAMSMERRKHLTMTKEKISLKPFLTSIIEQQKLRATKPCEITLDCAEDIVINADPTHFSNVISNLIDNSIKYSGDTVSITVKADNYAVSVSDNGIGIPPKSLPDIFNKFYRVPHGNRSDVRGYGIGLFYVKSIVDRHGWSIEAESKLGKGSRFTIKFTEQ
ncbi:MAG: HAMP domain-containing histidine kinase, partial [Muribaculaceae bacterium]|nr:HAMP domain-containing histidine kinase [Muribaculaceae bacterium]